MVFSGADKAIVKHYHEKGYTTYKIWKDNSEKHWNKTSVKRLIKRFEAFGTMQREKGPARPQTAATPENEKGIEEMICSQENHPSTHVPPKRCCAEIKDLTIFCTGNDQKKRNKTI